MQSDCALMMFLMLVVGVMGRVNNHNVYLYRIKQKLHTTK